MVLVPLYRKILEKFCSANMEDQGHQLLQLLHRQGNIRFAPFIELEQAYLIAPKKSKRFFEAAMPQFDEQGWSLLTDMPSLCSSRSRLTCEGDYIIILDDCPFNWLVVPALRHYLSSHKVMIDTTLSGEVADNKAEGGHTEQANWDRVRILKLVPTKLSEVTSKNETKLDKAMVDGTRIDCSPANIKLLQPENIKAVSESGFKMDGSTKDDKMLPKMESNTGGNVEAKAKEAGIVFITAASTNVASICWNKLIKFLSPFTKVACRVIKGVTRIWKTAFVMLLIISNPPIVSAVGSDNSTAVTSPFAPQTPNNTPPPPMPPSPVPKGGIRRLGPLSPSRMKKRSNLTESKELGLPPKKSPPSCLPAC